MRMNVTGATVTMLVSALAFGRLAHAGPADSPLPTFSDGKAAVAVYTAVGVIKNNVIVMNVEKLSLQRSDCCLFRTLTLRSCRSAIWRLAHARQLIAESF